MESCKPDTPWRRWKYKNQELPKSSGEADKINKDMDRQNALEERREIEEATREVWDDES